MLHLLVLDSRTIEKIGYIIGLYISFNQTSNVRMLIHVIVVDLPKSRGMILGREWSTKVKRGCYFLEGTHFTFTHKGVEVIIKREPK
jgi:hypothetical protein